MKTELIPISSLTQVCRAPSPGEAKPAPISVQDAGAAALFAWDEFFVGVIRNVHTRKAYERNVRRFLAWCEERSIDIRQISPGRVGRYLDLHPGGTATKKQHLAAIRRFFDTLVVRHVVAFNPAASVRGERLQVVDGRTPEIPVEQARKLLGSIDASNVVGLRDRAATGILIYTAARVEAVARLRLESLEHDGTQWTLRFEEKRGKSREIPVRHDLERFLLEYIDAAQIRELPGEGPLFRTSMRRTRRLTGTRMSAIDLCRMIKRRLKAAGLSPHFSPHSFRVTTITDLLSQGVPLDVGQPYCLLEHSCLGFSSSRFADDVSVGLSFFNYWQSEK